MTTSGRDNFLHIMVEPSMLNGLTQTSFVKCEQIMTISKARLDGHIGQLEPRYLSQVSEALSQLLGLD